MVEADEGYIGGRARNKAFGPPPKKMAVFVLVEREGEARFPYIRSRGILPVAGRTPSFDWSRITAVRH